MPKAPKPTQRRSPEAMKDTKVARVNTAKAVRDSYIVVAKSEGLKPKDVRAAVEGIMHLAAEQMKECGSFNLADMLNLRLKLAPSRSIYKMQVKAIPMKQLKELVSGDVISLPGGALF